MIKVSRINTNFEFSDQNMIPNAHDAYAYRVVSSEAVGQIAFSFPGEEVSFPRISNFSLREGYADGVEQRGYRPESIWWGIGPPAAAREDIFAGFCSRLSKITSMTI